MMGPLTIEVTISRVFTIKIRHMRVDPGCLFGNHVVLYGSHSLKSSGHDEGKVHSSISII